MTTQQAVQRIYRFEAFDVEGNLMWTDEIHNLTTNEGLNFINDTVFGGSAYTASWAVLLTDGTPVFAAGDTMASHAGWTEVTAYTETNRPNLQMGTSAAGAISNSANKAVFTFNASVTIGGAAISTSNTKGGTTGTLLGGGALNGGDASFNSGEVLQLTITNTITSA